MSSWLNALWRSQGQQATADASQPGRMLDVDSSLDITEVYPRLFIAGMPYKGPTSKESHRNNIDELSVHLRERYGERNFAVWNLTTEDKCTVDERKFREQVLKFPPVLSEADVAQLDDGLPQIGEIFRICYSLKFWLDLNSSHVAVLHEDKGKTRAPFVVASFLAWEHPTEFIDPMMALDRVGRSRPLPPSFPHTWRRTLLSMAQLCNIPYPMPARKLFLSTIIVYMTGTIRHHKDGVRLQVFCGRRLAWDSDSDSDRHGGRGEASANRGPGGVQRSARKAARQRSTSSAYSHSSAPLLVPDPGRGRSPAVSSSEGFGSPSYTASEAGGPPERPTGDDTDTMHEAADDVNDEDQEEEDAVGGRDGRYKESDYQFDEGLLKVRIEDLIQGDVQIHISAEIRTVVPPRILPTPAGDLPDLQGMDSMLVPRTYRKTLVRHAFHTNCLPPDAIQIALDQCDVPRANKKYVLASEAAAAESAAYRQGSEYDSHQHPMDGGNGGPAPHTTGINTGITGEIVESPGGKAEFWMQLVLAEAPAEDDDGEDAVHAVRGRRASAQVVRTGGRAGQAQQSDIPPLQAASRTDGSQQAASTSTQDHLVVANRDAQGKRSSSPTLPCAHDEEGMVSEHLYPHYKDWLNLRGRAAQLAGVFWFSEAHHVIPEQVLVQQLSKEFSLPHSHFAAAATQIAKRDMVDARRILRNELIQSLVRPREGSSLLAPRPMRGQPLPAYGGYMQGVLRTQAGMLSGPAAGSAFSEAATSEPRPFGEGEGGRSRSLSGSGLIASTTVPETSLGTTPGAGVSEAVTDRTRTRHGAHRHGAGQVSPPMHMPAASNVFIPVIATTLASMLVVGSQGRQGSGASAGTGGAPSASSTTAAVAKGRTVSSSLSLQDEHERVSLFLRQGLAQMLESGDEEEEEDHLCAGDGEADGGKALASGGGQAADAEEVVEGETRAEEDSVPARVDSIRKQSSTRHPGVGPHGLSSAHSGSVSRPIVRDLLGISPTAPMPHLKGASPATPAQATSIGVRYTPGRGMGGTVRTGAGRRRAGADVVMDTIMSSPDPALYLAGLQIATAVQSAEIQNVLVAAHHAEASHTGMGNAVQHAQSAHSALLSTLDPFILQKLLSALQELNSTSMGLHAGSPDVSRPAEAEAPVQAVQALDLLSLVSIATEARLASNSAQGPGGPHLPAEPPASASNQTQKGSSSSAASAAVGTPSTAGTVGVGWNPFTLGAGMISTVSGGLSSGLSAVVGTVMPSSVPAATVPPEGAVVGQAGDEDDKLQIRRARAVRSLAAMLDEHPQLETLFQALEPTITSARSGSVSLAQSLSHAGSASLSSVSRSAILSLSSPNGGPGVFTIRQPIHSAAVEREETPAGVGTPLPPVRTLSDFMGGGASSIGGGGEAALRQRGTDAAAASGDAGSKECKEPVSSVSTPVDMESLSKYSRMLKMGVPPAAAEVRMRADNIAAAGIAAILSTVGAVPSVSSNVDEQCDEGDQQSAVAALPASERLRALKQEQVDAAAEAALPLEKHPLWSQYFKMLRMGLPLGAVQQKMSVAGLDTSVLGLDSRLPHPTPPVSLASHPIYGKYMKMVKMGLPVDAVQHKLRTDGLDELIASLDPALPVPASLVSSTGAGAVGKKAAAPPPPPQPRKLRKKLHWDTLPADRIRQGETIWSRQSGGARPARGDGSSSSGTGDAFDEFASLEGEGTGAEEEEEDIFDEEELEALFTSSAGMPVGSSDAMKGGGKASTGAGGVVSLLDMKRGRAVGIGLAKLRMPHSLLRALLHDLTHIVPSWAIAALDTPSAGVGISGEASGTMEVSGYTGPAQLSAEQLAVLEDILPSPEELSLVKAYRGDRKLLGEAERFFLAVQDVPKAKLRAAALVFQQAFAGRTADVQARTTLLTAACAEVRRSKKLKRVLEAVLKLGNKLNSEDGASGSVAAAFTLASLLKLGTTKSFNGKTTLLQYLASALQKKDGPDALDLSSDLPSIGPSARVDLRVLKEDVLAIRKDLSNVERLVREQSRGRDDAGSMRSILSPSSAGLMSPASVARAGHGAQGVSGGSRQASSPKPFLASPKMGPAAAALEGQVSDAAPGHAQNGEEGVREEEAAAAQGEEQAGESDSLHAFVARAQTRLADLSTASESASVEFSSLLAYFGEEESMSVESFFSTLSAFVRALAKAKQELAEEAQRTAREHRAREVASQREKDKAERVLASSAAAAAAAASSGTEAASAAGGPTAEVGLTHLRASSLRTIDSASLDDGASAASGPSLGLSTPFRGLTPLPSRAVANVSVGGQGQEGSGALIEGASPDARKRLEALFKSKSNFFVRTGGAALPAGSSTTGTAKKPSAASAGGGAARAGSGQGQAPRVPPPLVPASQSATTTASSASSADTDVTQPFSATPVAVADGVFSADGAQAASTASEAGAIPATVLEQDSKPAGAPETEWLISDGAAAVAADEVPEAYAGASTTLEQVASLPEADQVQLVEPDTSEQTSAAVPASPMGAEACVSPLGVIGVTGGAKRGGGGKAAGGSSGKGKRGKGKR